MLGPQNAVQQIVLGGETSSLNRLAECSAMTNRERNNPAADQQAALHLQSPSVPRPAQPPPVLAGLTECHAKLRIPSEIGSDSESCEFPTKRLEADCTC